MTLAEEQSAAMGLPMPPRPDRIAELEARVKALEVLCEELKRRMRWALAAGYPQGAGR